jgi:hypothetical protein
VTEFGLYLNIGTIVALVGGSGGVVWKLSRIEKAMRDDMDAQVDNLQRDIARLERDASARGDIYRHEFGETAGAIRQKIHDVEVFSRDHFISKDTFSATVGRIEKMFESFGDRLERRFDKIDERFDKLAD